jgi:hypothetical protein
MTARGIRHTILLSLLFVDLLVLSLATWWLFSSPTSSAATTSPPPPSAIASAVPTTAQPNISAPASPSQPQRLSGGPDGALPNAPKLFIVAAAADHNGDTWLCTEGQGVYLRKGGTWQTFTTAQSLGDDSPCSVACDYTGRVWVGTDSHGVSIYNGSSFKTYDRFHGPAGSHIFGIATSPVDGDVWLATEAGLTRYSLHDDTWTTYDRSTGLPADQASAIAFDSEGTIYVGFPAIGISTASPTDHFATWTTTTGPDEMPIVPAGDGLPSRIVTSIAVAPGDIVYAGTSRGLARSTDHGKTWSYVRGTNWPALAKGRYMPPPSSYDMQSTSLLKDDWISSVAVDSAGILWIGYRFKGYHGFQPDGKILNHSSGQKVTAIAPNPGKGCIIATYGSGAILCGDTFAPTFTPPALKITPAKTADQFPSEAAPPSADDLQALQKQIESLPAAKDGIEYLGDDWETLGDWPGHYGSASAKLMGYRDFNGRPGYAINATTGPYRKAFMRYYWVQADKDPNSGRALVNPQDKSRAACENNDESYDSRSHPLTDQGPDLFLQITVPPGVHRVSLYFQNFDAHKGANYLREFPLEARMPVGITQTSDANPQDDPIVDIVEPSQFGSSIQPRSTIEAELAQTVARAYTPRYWCGVYKQFLVRGAGTYWIKIDRNHSSGAKVQGVFIDRFDSPITVSDQQFPWPKPPLMPSDQVTGALTAAALTLDRAIDAAVARDGYCALATRARTLAYRAALSDKADPAILANLRWKLNAWTSDDRQSFSNTMGIKPGAVQ